MTDPEKDSGRSSKRPFHMKETISSAGIVDVVFATARDQFLSEERRQSLLLAKANALLGASGLSLTVAFTFGGLLLDKKVPPWLAVPYVVALLLALASAVAAIYSMRIDLGMGIDFTTVFNAQALDVAQAADDESSSRGTTLYKKYLAEHFASMGTINSSRHARSADAVKLSQVFYGFFLGLILITGIGFAQSILCRPIPEKPTVSEDRGQSVIP